MPDDLRADAQAQAAAAHAGGMDAMRLRKRPEKLALAFRRLRRSPYRTPPRTKWRTSSTASPAVCHIAMPTCPRLRELHRVGQQVFHQLAQAGFIQQQPWQADPWAGRGVPRSPSARSPRAVPRSPAGPHPRHRRIGEVGGETHAFGAAVVERALEKILKIPATRLRDGHQVALRSLQRRAREEIDR